METKAGPFIRTTMAVGGFLVFALAYYLPLLLDSSALGEGGSPLRALFSEALAVPAVRIELARNLAGHLLPLVLCHAGVTWMAGRFARVTGLRTAVSYPLFLVATWLLLISGNRLLFPLSDYSIAFGALARPHLAAIAALLLGVGAVTALVPAFRRRRFVAAAALAGVVGISLGAGHWGHSTHAANPHARNIVIVGIDSLSGQMADAARDNLPYLAGLLEHATLFERAYTPLGRTFPAWTSLLTGQDPAEHGAVFNLRGLDRVQRDALVTRTLGEAGYHRVFAIDERRFSNIDESFGFDRVVGPKAGVLDFALQRLNDTPLTNLLLQTGAARHLLPFSRLNVASYANYDAVGFVDETLDAIDGAHPLFLAVHFESAHYPFRARHATRTFEHANHFVSRHLSALTAADSQLGRLVEGLRARGRLDDALMIVLSDHGESLGEVEASTTRKGMPFDVSGYGHGANLLSEHQNRIVLGLIRFRNGRPVGPATVHTGQVSLTDLRPTIERYARSGKAVLQSATGCMTVETGIRFAAASNYRVLDEKEVVAEASSYYEIDQVGRMHLREDRLPGLVETKDVGWRCRDRLTYRSSADGHYFAYRILEEGRRLVETEPDAVDIARIDAYRARLRQAVGG